MTRRGLIAPSLAGLLFLTLTALGQDQSAPPPRQVPPKNLSTINIQSVTPSATGISVEILGQNVRVLSASIDRQDPKTGSNLPVVNSVGIADIPSEIANPSVQAVGTAKFPIVVSSDPNTQYTFTLWAKSADDPNMDWGNPQTRIFKGYAPPVKPTAPTFKLTIGTDALNVSVDTPNLIETVTAKWQYGNNTVSTESTTGENPSVALKYDSLGGKSGELPSLVLSLTDPKTGDVQESRVTLAVAADQSLTTKAKQASQENSDKQKKASFSWQDLAKSGISAILKYFTAAAL